MPAVVIEDVHKRFGPVEVLKGVSHWILDEQPDTTAALLLDWFAGHPAD